jgi:hypothetical protein
MSELALADFVLWHTVRGECKCGRCVDVGSAPDPDRQHTIDMVFFKVAPALDMAITEATKPTFLDLMAHHDGVFGPIDFHDGKDHSYLEVGGWIGDQGIALQFMALGVMLGVFTLLTPYTMLRLPVGDPLAMTMAGAGYVSVKLARHSPISSPT